MTCGRVGSGLVPELWGKPLWEKVWPFLDGWDSVRVRTASTQWNIPGKYGPHGELLFFHQGFLSSPRVEGRNGDQQTT